VLSFKPSGFSNASLAFSTRSWSRSALSSASRSCRVPNMYLDRTLGCVPENLIGYFGGDWLAEQRTRNAERLRADTDAIRQRRGTKGKADVSPSIAIPLIQAAIDEGRELKEMWARLLAAALDPARTDLVRLSLIDLLKQLEPLDAIILQQLAGTTPFPGVQRGGDLADALAARFQIARDESFVSLEHLFELGCLAQSPNNHPSSQATAKARLLVRAVTD